MTDKPGPGEKLSGQVDEGGKPVQVGNHHKRDPHNTLDSLDTAQKTDLVKVQDDYNFKSNKDKAL